MSLTNLPFRKLAELLKFLESQGLDEEVIAHLKLQPDLLMDWIGSLRLNSSTRHGGSRGVYDQDRSPFEFEGALWPFEDFMRLEASRLKKMPRRGFSSIRPATICVLLEHSLEELEEVPKIGQKTREAILASLEYSNLHLSTHLPGQPGFVRFTPSWRLGPTRWVRRDRALEKTPTDFFNWFFSDTREKGAWELEKAGLTTLAQALKPFDASAAAQSLREYYERPDFSSYSTQGSSPDVLAEAALKLFPPLISEIRTAFGVA
ncbi:MAG TPA: hypothetical protein VLI05_01420 [Candidatus Saccharimonadia bacterium]|nr:hypothetical protein [Candidatus Saccharimonadia bacterium]